MISLVSTNKVNYPSLQQHFEKVANAASSKRKEVVAKPFPTTKACAKEVFNFFNFDFSSAMPITKQTLGELGRNVTGLAFLVSHVLLHPRTVLNELRIYNGDYELFEKLLLNRVPIEQPEYTHLRGGLHIVPFNQFDPATNDCLNSGDSRLGMLLKDDKDNPFIVKRSDGTEGNLYWVTKKDGRYDGNGSPAIKDLTK